MRTRNGLPQGPVRHQLPDDRSTSRRWPTSMPSRSTTRPPPLRQRPAALRRRAAAPACLGERERAGRRVWCPQGTRSDSPSRRSTDDSIRDRAAVSPVVGSLLLADTIGHEDVGDDPRGSTRGHRPRRRYRSTPPAAMSRRPFASPANGGSSSRVQRATCRGVPRHGAVVLST